MPISDKPLPVIVIPDADDLIFVQFRWTQHKLDKLKAKAEEHGYHKYQTFLKRVLERLIE